MNEYITKRRMVFTSILFFVAFLILGGRLFYVQIVRGAEYSNLAAASRTGKIVIAPQRGTIYDSKGNELAISTSAQTIHAIPSEVQKSGKTDIAVAILAADLNMDRDFLASQLGGDKSFVYIKRQIEPDLANTIKSELDAAEVKGLYFTTESKRYYPHGSLASNVLGICGVDNNGLEGIEFYYENLIGGQPGEMVAEKDGQGTELPRSVSAYKAPVEGTDAKLAIDSTIQYIVEEQLDKVYTERKAAKAVAIVMNPKNGEIVAMASRPTFDPNQYGDYPAENRRNIAISDVYEPGSTMKVCTAAMALESGVCSLDSSFFCPGYIDIGDKTIKCAHSNAHGDQTFAQILENSCNVGFVTVGQRIGLDSFYSYMDKFGYGKLAGVDLPGEARGLIIPRDSARLVDLGTMSIGQANAVTPLQLIDAIACIGNNGIMNRPHVLKAVRNSEGEWQDQQYDSFARQVISPATAGTMMSILESEVVEGTGQNALMEGYRVGGKTGTAEKVGPDGKYLANEYVVSFIGIAPCSDPQLVCLVVVDGPQGESCTGGDVAAPVVKEILKKSFEYMQVPYDKGLSEQPEEETGGDQVTVPDLVGLNAADASSRLSDKGLLVITDGTGDTVWKQNVAAGIKLSRGDSVVIYVGQAAAGQVLVPDFSGKSIKKCASLAADNGLVLVPNGCGLAASQNPAAGTLISAGSQVQVEFGDD